MGQKFATVKQRVWRVHMHKNDSQPHFIRTCDRKHNKTHSKSNFCNRKLNKTNALATFWTENTIKHNRYLQQTPAINSRNRDLQQTLTMDTIDAYNRHSQQTLTIDTYNRHLQQTQQTLTIDTCNRHLQ